MDYYVSPRFTHRVALHLTKNYLGLNQVPVPLILGIHGKKGEGKTFQCNLVFERMGVNVVHMSGGELESPDAGDPARLLRLRYREASELVKLRGKMAVVLINDIDAGAGRFDRMTQYTVNTQLVNATLMNIADNPTNVQLPGSYDSEPVQRIPIVVTGNDFGTLYAPLLRDGRMGKFYWEPTREERLETLARVFSDVSLPRGDVGQLLDRFSEQSVDFFGAIKSRAYDHWVEKWMAEVGLENLSSHLAKAQSGRKSTGTTLPTPTLPPLTLTEAIAYGEELEAEQQKIQELHLVEAYNQYRSENSHSSGATNGNGRSRPYATVPAAENAQSQPPSSPAITMPTIPTSSPALDMAVHTEVQGIINSGLRLGVEHANQRRFRANHWECFGTVDPGSGAEAEAIALVSAALGEHTKDFVRLVAINPSQRRRIREQIIQRP
ncbi:MAG: AAA family ATPase [Cyanobacteria bacterium P01_D01_bin.73]